MNEYETIWDSLFDYVDFVKKRNHLLWSERNSHILFADGYSLAEV